LRPLRGGVVSHGRGHLPRRPRLGHRLPGVPCRRVLVLWCRNVHRLPGGLFPHGRWHLHRRAQFGGRLRGESHPPGLTRTPNPLPPSPPVCQACPAGSYLADGALTISSHDSADDCESCPAGKYLSDDAGTVSEHDSAAKCKVCVAGSYSSSPRAATCSLCPVGKFLADGGGISAHDSMDDCQVCPAGTSSSAGAATCTVCEAGSYHEGAIPGACSVCRTCRLPLASPRPSRPATAHALSQLPAKASPTPAPRPRCTTAWEIAGRVRPDLTTREFLPGNALLAMPESTSGTKVGCLPTTASIACLGNGTASRDRPNAATVVRFPPVSISARC